MHEVKQQGKEVNNNRLIIIFGLPGSGKTTFASQLKQKYYPDSILINGDKIQAEIYLKKQLIEKSTQEYKNIIEFYEQIQKKQYPRVKFDPLIWKQSRKIIEKDVNQLIKYKTVIIQDDLLYRSQRRIYQKISWHTNTPYIQLFMDTSLQDCLSNIKSRKKSENQCDVTVDVLGKAFKKLQLQKHDEEYLLMLNFDDRKNRFVSREQIETKMRVIQVIPNDPNDPNSVDYFHKGMKKQEKEEVVHSRQEELEIVLKRFVGEIMHGGIETIKGVIEQMNEQLVLEMKQKKKLAKMLAMWKKHYVKQRQRTIQRQKIEQDLIYWLKNTYKE